ncbi:MAG TPA: L-threonine 3-dehydrogenase [Candidatus Krumholzibacteriaceae bacterium]|nr:L-threonine 3-dehydrogenase [Candidatus Krumholzibacteriaceae bacterium]
MGDQVSRVLITGALGQIGSELTLRLRELFGKENVVATDIRQPVVDQDGPFETLDVLMVDDLRRLIKEHEIDTVYHLAAILSATGEQKPDLAWKINIEGLMNVLNAAKDIELRVFHPSSIAAFGPETPRVLTPQETVLKPRTMYGITKVAGELLGNYYFEKYGVDVRGVRLPGIISNVAPPGGGTTDYAVEIFYEAIKHKKYACFLREDTVLPMMYMPDCLKAFVTLMDAPLSSLKHHGDYNLAALSFNPRELAAEIKRHIPEFEIVYRPDYRQAIADSWPKSIDDSASRKEWGWSPDYDMPAMVEDMISVLGARHREGCL